MNEYVLWWLTKSDDWANISQGSVFQMEETLKEQALLTLDLNIDASLFKIAKVGDTAWMNYLPSNIMKGGK